MKVMFHTEVRKYFRTVAYEGNTNVYQTTCTTLYSSYDTKIDYAALPGECDVLYYYLHRF